ncbi:MAG: P-loop containing nucleoside triphosphate hydrolase protein [Monoraphidium minutum]|nr:MAG: P-loop containing nucleoside triphosphate hydrolase protein [Monoraphidium minutum]
MLRGAMMHRTLLRRAWSSSSTAHASTSSGWLCPRCHQSPSTEGAAVAAARAPARAAAAAAHPQLRTATAWVAPSGSHAISSSSAPFSSGGSGSGPQATRTGRRRRGPPAPAAAALDGATPEAANTRAAPAAASAAAADGLGHDGHESDSGGEDELEDASGGGAFGGGQGVGAEDDGFPTLRLDLPAPTNVRIRTAEFVKSSVEVGQCPKEGPPEFAIIGRSNVGKSSLINMLTGRKSLAQVSKEPGKTQCINHFIINGSWYLVDLPGYGYAKRSKDMRRVFDTFTKAYFRQRGTLAMVLLLVDASIPPQPVDLDYAAYLASAGVPFSLVFTKADKRKKGGPGCAANVAAFKRALLEGRGLPLLPPSVVTSAAEGAGKGELLAFLASLRGMWEAAAKGGGGGRR